MAGISKLFEFLRARSATAVALTAESKLHSSPRQEILRAPGVQHECGGDWAAHARLTTRTYTSYSLFAAVISAAQLGILVCYKR